MAEAMVGPVAHGQVRARARVKALLDRQRRNRVNIASIGMFEHVGVSRFNAYFNRIHHALKPGGLVLTQGTTQSSTAIETLGSGPGEFVEDHVFPGGQLAHVSRVIDAMGSEGLEVFDAKSR